jgi:diguanylate cyclase (GGDEF)-like protein
MLPLGCSGDCRYVDVTVTALDTGQPARPAHLVVLHDVTEEQTNIMLLEIANTELERRQERIEVLNEELHAQATRDPLTGLYNRRYLDDSLPREIARSHREAEPLGFLAMDIDDFKSVNDDHSHGAGDVALVMVSEVLSSNARGGDIVCRHGGDEFLVVMLGAGTSAAHRRAEDLRRQIEAMPVVWDDEVLHITVSIGVSSLPACGTTAEDAIVAADRALYRAKESGRNATVAAPETEGSW